MARKTIEKKEVKGGRRTKVEEPVVVVEPVKEEPKKVSKKTTKPAKKAEPVTTPVVSTEPAKITFNLDEESKEVLKRALERLRAAK